MDLFAPYHRTEQEIEQEIDRILRENEKEVVSPDHCKQILSFMDLTSLEATDNITRMQKICNTALVTQDPADGQEGVAAVCFFPPFIRSAKKIMENSGIAVASVAGYFPSGQAPLSLKLDEIRYALDQGADEIDTVLSRGRFLAGDIPFVMDEIAAQKEVCKDVHLKVILETGELSSVENIRKASEIALTAGADFIKTSTGKSKPAATPLAFFVMAETVREYAEKTGGKAGVKAAGGIATAEQAVVYLNLLENILGKEWKTKHLFRIGASRLLDDLLSRITSSNEF